MGSNTMTGVASCRGYAKNTKLVNRENPDYEFSKLVSRRYSLDKFFQNSSSEYPRFTNVFDS